MKSIKQIALTVMITLGAFSAITYTACNKDACKSVTCNNGGTCSGGTCTCATGYEGTSCQTASRDKFDKTWSANETSVGTNGSKPLVYSPTIAASTTATSVTAVNISGLATDGTPFFNNLVTATVSANVITIPTQSPDNDSYSVSGSGTYANGIITWNYQITQASSSTIVNISGTWK
jgi:hypothetical protein